jgi:preprotein translocase subunit SecD
VKTALLTISGLAAAALVTACSSAAPPPAPASPGNAPAATPPSSAPGQQTSSPAQVVSITLSPTAPASAGVLAAAARLLRQRLAHVNLPDTGAEVAGPNVVLTGPAGDEAQLEALAAPGVLQMRQVLRYQAAGGPAYGNAGLVQADVLALFAKLTCPPGDTTQWKSQVGYTTARDYDNPDVQVVACGQNGPQPQSGKYALGVAKVQGSWVTSARAVPSSTSNQWQVYLTLNSQGAAAFGTLTTQLYKAYFGGATAGNQDDAALDEVAVTVDGNVVFAPQVDGPIPFGVAQIAGGTRDQAQDLAAQLQTGPLPADFRITSVSTRPT